MSTQFYSLKALKARVDSLIEQQGEDAPVAYWIYTNEDVLTFDDDGNEQYYPINVCQEVLADVQDFDYIYQQIQECIDDEIRYYKSKNKVAW